jgi:WD40 repeat protein
MSAITAYNNKNLTGSRTLNWDTLGAFRNCPFDVIKCIFFFLTTPKDLYSASLCNWSFQRVSASCDLWKSPAVVTPGKMKFHAGHGSFNMTMLENKQFCNFLNDSLFLCQSVDDHTLEIWDLKTKKLMVSQPHTKEIIFCSEISKNRFIIVDANKIYICSFKHEVKAPFTILAKHEDNGKKSLIEHVEDRLIVGYENGDIKIFDLRALDKPLILSGGHTKSISFLGAIGNYLVSRCKDVMKIWDLNSKNSVQKFPPTFDLVGDCLYYFDQEKKSIVAYNVKEQRTELELKADGVKNILSIDVKGEHLVVKAKINHEFVFHIWNLKTHESTSVSMKKKYVSHWDLIDNRIYIGFKDGDIEIYNLKLKFVKLLKGHTTEITCFNVVGNCLISGAQRTEDGLNNDSTVRIWDLEKQKCIACLPKLFDSIVSLMMVDNCLIIRFDKMHFKASRTVLDSSSVSSLNFTDTVLSPSTLICDFDGALIPGNNSNVVYRTIKSVISFIKNF